MADELEVVVRALFEALDKGDPSIAQAAIASDAQGIDEISRRWMRGRDEVSGYVIEMMGMVSDVHSELHDVHESIRGDTGMLTCWLEQDYTMSGDRVHISAPTSIVLRREDGTWKIALFHSLPLSDAS